ncbi:unnamed protein product [Polarella glacialis]|uniref:Alpha/beta hydrolase fold-3 domain-containing protein n=1 Tax=Polarella glacialis TaxID=89957 RepID=A0A813GCP8_POLGL|nr:unnamed protein product [Polarella glacialis]
MADGAPCVPSLMWALFRVLAVLQPCSAAAFPYMTEVTNFCYQSLMNSPSCCKDQTPPSSVRGKNVERTGAAWECVRPEDGGNCGDVNSGQRGKDTYWWREDADCSTPRILFVHGGGWSHNGPRQASYDVLAAKLAQFTGAAVFVPDFPLVPVTDWNGIHSYLDSAWDWLSTHGASGEGVEDCSAAPRPPLFVAGDSSGAASALTLVLRLQQQQAKPLADGFFAFSPWLNMACDTPTYQENSFAVVSDGGHMEFVGDILFRGQPGNTSLQLKDLALSYLGNQESLLMNPISSPFHATKEQLQALPPVYIAVSGSEVLAGDGIIFANRLAQQGIPVYLDVFMGMWHGFVQNSEGCGYGKQLWQGLTALSHAGDFVVQLSKQLEGRNGGKVPTSVQSTPRTTVHYPHPEGAEPWVPVLPLHLGIFLDEKAAKAADVTMPALEQETSESKIVVVKEVGQSCTKAMIMGDYLTGFIGGAISTVTLLCFAAFWLHRSHGHLPQCCPQFLKDPFDNFSLDSRSWSMGSMGQASHEDEREFARRQQGRTALGTQGNPYAGAGMNQGSLGYGGQLMQGGVSPGAGGGVSPYSPNNGYGYGGQQLPGNNQYRNGGQTQMLTCKEAVSKTWAC